MSELTTRQFALYNLLKENPNHWWSQEEICERIKTYAYTDDERNHCVDIGTDQRAINESEITDKIIITDKHCFKIATEEEYKHYRSKLIARIQNAVKQIEAWDSKYERNGQGKLFNNVLNELKPENEQFHETFIEAPKLEKAKSKTRVFVDLENYKAYIVKNVGEYTLNEETLIAYIYTDQTEIELLNIHEVIDEEQLARPFYEKYERIIY